MHFLTTSQLYDVIGTTGAALILLGFYRISIGHWTSKSFWYELDNVFGPGFLIIYQLHYRAYISVVLNVIWVIVAFRGIVSFVERYQANQKRHKKHRRA